MFKDGRVAHLSRESRWRIPGFFSENLAGGPGALVVSTCLYLSFVVTSYAPLVVMASGSVLLSVSFARRPHIILTTLYNLAWLCALFLFSPEPGVSLGALALVAQVGLGAFGVWLQQTHHRALEEAHDKLTHAIHEKSELEEASRAKSAFLANMSHELRTPLNAVIGYSEIITDELLDEGRCPEDQILKDIDHIQDAGRQLLAMISDVLDLSKIEAGRVDIVLDSFQVSELVEEVMGTMWPLMDANDNVLIIDIDPSCGMMRSDRIRLRQVLLNILSNAAKFTHQGQVEMRVWRGPHEGKESFCFEVKDSGIGMSEEELSRIFKAFEQADVSTTREYGGTGLGLTLCERLCQMLGGEIQVTSKPGEGTTFTIIMPAVMGTSNEIERRVQTLDDKAWQVPHVLLIDDDTAVHDSLGHMLERAGYRVRSFLSAKEALEHACHVPPSVILLDILMPGMDGWEALRQIRATRALRALPVVLISILDEHHTVVAQNADAILVKPLVRERVLHTLRQFYEPEGYEVSEAEFETETPLEESGAYTLRVS